MAVKNQVTEQTAVWRQWLLVQGPRVLAPVGFLVVHVTGGVFALLTLKEAWRFRLLLQILTDRVTLFGVFGLPWLIIPVCLSLVAILALVGMGRILRRRWRRQLEPDVFLRLRTLLYVAMACVMVNALYLSTPETFSGPFRVRFPINAQISAAFAYGAYALWSLLLPQLRRAVPGRIRRGLDVLGMNAVLLLVLAEISLRILGTFWASPLLVTESSPLQIRRDAERRQPGTLLFGFPMNQGGHYDTEFLPPSADRGPVVVSIGDSFSYGVVPHTYHYTTVAERESPGVEIYNMGYPGTGPIDYLYLLEHDALPLEPDLVVVQLFVGNDVADDGGYIAGSPRWYDADSYLIAIVWYRLQILRRAKRVNVAEVAERSSQVQAELPVRYPWLADPFLEPRSIDREVYLQLELQNALAICAPIEGVYERFFEALAVMEWVADDVPVAFVLIPDEFQVEDDLWEEIVRRSDQPLDRDRPQRLVVEWLNARGWPVLDLLPLLRAVEPMEDGRQHVYHRQDTHFNVRGNEVAGRALASFVDSLLSVNATRQGGSQITPPVSLPLQLDIGDSTARRWMRRGWYEDEAAGGETFAWSDGVQSVLTVPLPTAGDIRMDFEVLPFVFRRSPQQRVTIVLNGTVIEELELRPGLQRYSVILPAAALRESLDTLEFRYAYARAPQEVLRNSLDVRLLAVAWYSIEFAVLNP